MRIGTDLLVGLLDEDCELGLRHAPVLDAHLDGEAKAATVACADGNRAGHFGFASILFVLFPDEVESAAKAGRIARPGLRP